MREPYKQEGALLRRVRELMGLTTIPALDIYKATGISPNQQWAIKSGKTKAPSVNVIECLFDFLNGRELTVNDLLENQIAESNKRMAEHSAQLDAEHDAWKQANKGQ